MDAYNLKFRVRRRLLLIAFVSTAVASCIEAPPRSAFAPATGDAKPSAHVLALSTYDASLGTVIDAHGLNLPDPMSASAGLHFLGNFTRDDQTVEPVDFATDARALDGSTLRWSGFGPYGNPFSSNAASMGLYEGTVAARVFDASGAMTEDSDPISIRFEVKPSIVVHELEPISASCTGSVKRVIGGAPYRVRVEAVGFNPSAFTYTLSAPALSNEPTAIRHLASGRFDSVGDDGDFVIPPVPEDQGSYDVVISVQARDDAHHTFATSFAIAVHRPLEVFYDGNVDLAEILAPVPVSGCIPGGEAGRMVQYSEAMEETRMKGFNVNWNESWLTAHTVAHGMMGTVGSSETNGVGFSSTDETNWHWSLGMEASGSLSVEKLVELGLSVNTMMGAGGSHADQTSGSHQKSLDTSETTTDTAEASQQMGSEHGGSFSWQTSSGMSISRAFGGTVIAGTFGVFYRQTLRLIRRASIVTYNQCGAATVVGNVDFSDWAWSPDLALGNSCPPLPASNLPAAKCLIPPCAGD